MWVCDPEFASRRLREITGEPLNSRSRILDPNKREITGVDCNKAFTGTISTEIHSKCVYPADHVDILCILNYCEEIQMSAIIYKAYQEGAYSRVP